MMKNFFIAALTFALFLHPGCRHEDSPEKGPRIGITYGSIQSRLLRLGIDINEQYKEALKAQGASTVMISVRDGDADVMKKLSICDGLLIPGGYDIEPSRYGEKRDARLEATDPSLDALEFTVLEYARSRQLPVLGICRGEQMINVFYGGSLYQDIPAMLKSNSPVAHRKAFDILVYKHATPCYHDIRLEKDSLLRDILGTPEIRVNTYHHQAVKTPAPGFSISARSADGSVEAIEHRDKQFVFGVQFHPEKMIDENPVVAKIFRTFMEEVLRRRTAGIN